mgnify:CR=1
KDPVDMTATWKGLCGKHVGKRIGQLRLVIGFFLKRLAFRFNGGEHPLGAERQFRETDANGIFDGIGDGTGNGQHAAFTHPFCPKRSGAMALLLRDGPKCR